MVANKSFGTGSSEKAALEASATRSTESFAATNTTRDSHDSSGASIRERGWNFRLLFGVRGFAIYTDYPHRFFVAVGPWAIEFGPWSRTSRYANGSRWHSGWHRPDEVEF